MTESSKKNVDSCRFCWMCRHICPIGKATGQERNNARARALGLSLVNRNALGLAEVIDNLYECACCGACTKECVTGWDPMLFTRQARLDAAMEGVLPEYIGRLVDNCLETGNAYGITEPEDFVQMEIQKHEKQEEILLFLGVDARYRAPLAAVNAIRVLETAKVSFTVLEKEPASGWQLEYLVSAVKETKEQMTACAKELNRFQRVVVFDPQDARICKREYPEWGVELTAEVVTFTAFVAKLLKTGALCPQNRNLTAVYQDPFQLARELDETQPAREVISAYAARREMLCHGKDTMWAGNLLMREWMPEVMLLVAADRIEQAERAGADAIVTASVSEYASLKAVKQDKIRILSLEELILGE